MGPRHHSLSAQCVVHHRRLMNAYQVSEGMNEAMTRSPDGRSRLAGSSSPPCLLSGTWKVPAVERGSHSGAGELPALHVERAGGTGSLLTQPSPRCLGLQPLAWSPWEMLTFPSGSATSHVCLRPTHFFFLFAASWCSEERRL